MQTKLLETQRQTAVQQERERVARDMHDDMGQIMGFVNVQAQAVQEYLKRADGRGAEMSRPPVRSSSRSTYVKSVHQT